MSQELRRCLEKLNTIYHVIPEAELCATQKLQKVIIYKK